MALVSIILTCYKQEDFIEETILSVINQRFVNRELLIGDDSPDDKCRNIILRYVKKYPNKIKAWHHNPNKGIVNNMEFLMSKIDSKSDFVAFIEGDDCWFQDYLNKKIEIFNEFPSVQLVYNEFSIIDKDSNIVERKHLKKYVKCFYKGGKLNYEKLINEVIYMSRSSLMIRKNIVRKYMIQPPFLGKNTIISDLYFFNQIAHNEDIYGIEKSLMFYRRHIKSASGDIKGAITLHLELVSYMKYLFGKGYISELVCKSLINKWYFMICVLSLKMCLRLGVIITIKNLGKESFYYIKRHVI